MNQITLYNATVQEHCYGLARLLLNQQLLNWKSHVTFVIRKICILMPKRLQWTFSHHPTKYNLWLILIKFCLHWLWCAISYQLSAYCLINLKMNNMYLTLASQNEDEGVNNLLYYRPMNRSVNPLNCGEFALL